MHMCMCNRAGNEAECKRLLNLKDIDLHERDMRNRYKGNNRSAIIIASNEGHVSFVELLLSKGANVNDKDNDGNSSIIQASICCHVSVVEMLLSKGANINDISNDGSTAMSVASSDKIKCILSKWPITMAILILKELDLYYLYDASTLIDLYQYLGEDVGGVGDN